MSEVVVFFPLHPENQPWLLANWLWSCRDMLRLSLASTKAPTKPMECFRPLELSLVLKPVALCSPWVPEVFSHHQNTRAFQLFTKTT